MTSKQRKRPRIVREPEELGSNSAEERDARGRFRRGNTLSRGNRGRSGQRGIKRMIAAALTDADLRAIVRRARDQARGGDPVARAWISDRLDGRPRTEPDDSVLALELPALVDASSCAEAAAAIVAAAAGGHLTLEEAAGCMNLVDAAREGVVLRDLEDRLQALEASE